ncbi:MAG: NAD-binding protein [Methylococcaceae bacterium]|nr:NAD-binding protein [Methylococcaceae bacterium]
MKKIAIFGYNLRSFEAISRLDQNLYDLLIVEPDSSLAALAEEKGYKTALIDFRSDEALNSIGLGKDIEIIFCFLPEDSENVFLTLSARALDQNLNIIAIVDTAQSAEKLIAAGANKIIDPYQICGQKIHELITKPDIANIIDHTVFGRNDLHVAEILIPENSYLDNTFTSELTLNEKHNLVLLGIVDKELGDDLHFSIGEKDHKLDPGDIIVVMGPSREIKAFKKEVEYVQSNKI